MAKETKTRYIFFGHGRSGSHLLGDYINQHPNAYFDDELFNSFRLKKMSALKRRIAKHFPFLYFKSRINAVQKEVYGFSFIIYQFKIARTTLNEMFNRGWKIIYLNRDNVFDQMISHQVAFKKNNWHNKKTKDAIEHVSEDFFTLDKEQCLDSLKRNIELRIAERELVDKIPHYSVNYERDLKDTSNHQKTLDGVFHFLEISPIKLSASNYKKVFSKPYSEIVTNYSEIKDEAIERGLIKPK